MKPIAIVLLLVFSLPVFAADARRASPGNTTYHIDPAAGDDGYAGTSADRAWKTFHPVNRMRLAPGDRVEIKPGRFDHTLAVAGRGTSAAPIEIRFMPGRYDFDPVNAHREKYQISNTNGDPDGAKAVGILLTESEHVRAIGPGAVIHARGKMIHVCIDGCESIAIDGLSFDYHRPTVSEFTVTAADDDGADLTVHGDSPYSVENGTLVWQGEGWKESGGLGQELDPETGRVHRMRDPLGGLRIGETGPFRLRAHGKHRLKAGRVYQIRNPFRDCCGAFTRDSRHIAWRDVRFRFMHGMGMVSQFSENLTFDSVHIAPDPESGRTTAAWADCIHFSGCRGKILVKKCVFSGAHDDAVNVHGTHLRVVAKPEPDKVRVRFMHAQTFGFMAFHPGDEVDFVHSDTLDPYATNRVVEARMIDPKEMELTMEKPVPAELREHDVLENVTWTPQVEIRGCTVRHIPTRGFLVTTRRPVLVEDNDFHATHMSAILIENDAEGWFESGCVRDMLIRDNRFHRCGEPVIHINPRNSAGNPAVHRNIRILENGFELSGQSAVKAHGTDGLEITGNTVRGAAIDEAKLFQTRDCDDVAIHGNQVVREP